MLSDHKSAYFAISANLYRDHLPVVYPNISIKHIPHNSKPIPTDRRCLTKLFPLPWESSYKL